MGLETLALVAGGLGSAVSGLGAIQKGQATQNAANYNAAVDTQQAAEAKDRAAASAQDYLRTGSNTVQSAVADQSASGVTMEGSPLMVDENTVRQVALGASRTLQAGNVQASRYLDDAQLKKMQGDAAVSASYLDAGSSLLTGASKFANPNYGKGGAL